MTRIPLSSSLIHSIDYNQKSNSLEVFFHNGGIYLYRNVPEKVYENLINADSAGSYYSKNIRGKFPSRKLPTYIYESK